MQLEVQREAFDTISNDEITILDNAGLPSVMVPIKKFKSSEIDKSLPEHTHPAFIVNGKEAETVYVSKYINVVFDGRAYSLPGQTPRTHISFDEAVEVCRKKGEGWGLMPASLWAAIALWCKKNNTVPKGNTKFGRSFDNPLSKGEATDTGLKRIYMTKTGSGPAEWNHDHTEHGISDLVGNVFEWQAGLRSVKANISVIPNADCIDHNISLASDSASWKFITEEGTFTDESDKGLKLDFNDEKAAFVYKSGIKLDSAMNTARYCEFRNLMSDINVPDILKELILFPKDGADTYKRDLFYMANLLPEGIAFRGGYFDGDFMSGIFNTGFNMMRTDKTPYIGFRSVYYKFKD